jgi:Zinc carboxypeptidase
MVWLSLTRPLTRGSEAGQWSGLARRLLLDATPTENPSMKLSVTSISALLLLSSLHTAPGRAIAQSPPPSPSPAKVVTSPKEFFGFNIGDDYCLANYQQLMGYWEKLDSESDRIKVMSIGTTEEGRPHLAAIVTSPANQRELERFQKVARRLALADGVDQTEARKLANEGKAVVWIDGGIHASETLGAQSLIESVYQLVVAQDEEALRILNDVIIIFVHANPDGHDLIADWYMREKDPKKRSLAGVPRLYQKYIGHDNNRDFYANTQAETKNMNQLMYRFWFPQVMYDHHQTGPAGTVLFCPPFRDPFNYFCDPLVINGIDSLGAAMIQRFLVEGKPGATIRSGAPYSTWFNGGIRTTTSFHNMIGLLTETIGSPTPMQVPLVASRQLPKGDYLAPVTPQPWHFRQSIDYSVTSDRAVLDYASRHREQLLYNIWLMGHNAIDRGNRDSWTITPKIVEAAQGGRDANARGGRAGGGGGGGGGGRNGEAEFARLFHDPARRDARGYILPADQPDFLTATKFINTLLGTGVRVHQALSDFNVAGKAYPKGSYVVKTSQAFRAHVLDMFEPQDHPNDFSYPGGPPVRPYDSAGYTPAFQMALKFDRVLDGFNGPFEVIKDLVVAPPPAQVLDAEKAEGFFLSVRTNDAFRAVNRLLKAGEEVRRLQGPAVVEGVTHAAGMFYIARKPSTLPLLEKIAAEIGTPFRGSSSAPGSTAVPIRAARIALWDRTGGSMPSGWTRWLLEQFEFPFQVVHATELDKAGLREKFDTILLVDGAYGAGGRGGPEGNAGADRPDEAAAGAPERPAGEGPNNRRTVLTQTNSLPHLKAFLEAGGTVLAIGGSTRLGRDLGLPLANHLVEPGENNEERALPPEKFYVPSSVLRMRVDRSNPLAWGLLGNEVDVMFSASPTFRLLDDAEAKGIRRVGWFDTKTPLRSGWAWGQERLEGGTAIVDARVGQGRLALFGPQVLFRGQPHGTFKLVFNGIVQSALDDSRP